MCRIGYFEKRSVQECWRKRCGYVGMQNSKDDSEIYIQ